MKRVHGQRTSSYGRKYVYRRKLDEIPHVRLIREVVITVGKEDEGRPVARLEAEGAESCARKVQPTHANKVSSEQRG